VIVVLSEFFGNQIYKSISKNPKILVNPNQNQTERMIQPSQNQTQKMQKE
jgi:hypothetical protein